MKIKIKENKRVGKYQAPSILNVTREKKRQIIEVKRGERETNNQKQIDCGGNNSKILFGKISLSQKTSSLNNVTHNGGSIK